MPAAVHLIANTVLRRRTPLPAAAAMAAQAVTMNKGICSFFFRCKYRDGPGFQAQQLSLDDN
jgi:hypothetical protein